LPSEDSNMDDEDDLKGDKTDDELEDYYEELGIQDEEDVNVVKTPKQTKKEKDKLYKKTKKAKSEATKEEAPTKSKKMVLIEQMIKRAKEETTYNNVSRIIKIIKQIFNTPHDEDEGDNKDSKDPAKA
jgi:tRNA U34 5-carboxymethylaminomethyl modifying enzyme MnmG/GidA